jgi:hypothetical protein
MKRNLAIDYVGQKNKIIPINNIENIMRRGWILLAFKAHMKTAKLVCGNSNLSGGNIRKKMEIQLQNRQQLVLIS